MTCNLSEILENYKTEKKIIIGFNVFGYEDALQIIRASEALNRPCLIMTNRDACKEMDVVHWGKLLRSIGEAASVPISVHLDHSSDLELIKRAIDAGYTSVMYDGSALPIEENIINSKEIVRLAHEKGVIVECELGYVPYSDITDAAPVYTKLSDVKRFTAEVDADMLAVSVGNIHKQTESKTRINFEHLNKIQEITDVPLVIHGSSGIQDDDLIRLKNTNVCKVNIGTNIRMAFGCTLRETVKNNPKEFDRLNLMGPSKKAVYEEAYRSIKLLSV